MQFCSAAHTSLAFDRPTGPLPGVLLQIDASASPSYDFSAPTITSEANLNLEDTRQSCVRRTNASDA